MPTSVEKLKSFLRLTVIIGNAIREAGSIPSGILYANVLSHASLDTYQKAIGVLKKAGMIREQNHELHWIGLQPDADPGKQVEVHPDFS